MVQINKFKIDSKKDVLIIDVSIEDLDYFKDVYIESITIDTQDTFKEVSLSDNPVYSKTFEEDLKEVHLELGKGDILPSLQDNLFILTVKAKGTPAADTPCGLDSQTNTMATVDFNKVYCTLLSNIKDSASLCEPPRAFIDKYIQYKGLQIAMITKKYLKAIEFYNKFFKNMKYTYTKKCGCHGR
jgi:hypothetical protein